MYCDPPLSRLLALPLELRYRIYGLLCRKEPLCYPFPRSPITSIDHIGPPRALLLTCKNIFNEVHTYYHGLATFRMLALGSSRTRRDDLSEGTLKAIRSARKVELMLMWNITNVRAEAGPGSWPWWMNGWLAEQTNLLLDEAHELKVIYISLRDASLQVDWELKRPLLAPLQALKGKVLFLIGEFTGADEEESKTRQHIQEYLDSLNK